MINNWIILLLFIAGIFSAQNVIAQLVNKGQVIAISPDTEVWVSGDLISQGSLSNQGTLLVTGDWRNTAGYGGGGTVVLAGEQHQTVDHSGQEFFNLMLDGAGEKTFVSGATILGELYLHEGILTPEAEAVLLVKDKAFVSDGSSRSYVNGRLFHEGTGEKYYPIGKDGSFKPVVLTAVGRDPVVGLEMFQPNPYREHASNITEVSASRYWEKTMLSGVLSEESSLTLPVGSDALHGEMDQLVIGGASSADKNFRVTGNAVTSGFMDNGTISSPILSDADYFTLALLEDAQEILLYIPNAFAPFSPKADSEDRVLKVYGKDISDQGFLFRIYNRWGKVVYETTSYDEASRYGWNGVDQTTGQSQSFGAYQYILKGIFNTGKPIDRKGSIYLIR